MSILPLSITEINLRNSRLELNIVLAAPFPPLVIEKQYFIADDIALSRETRNPLSQTILRAQATPRALEPVHKVRERSSAEVAFRTPAMMGENKER